MKIMYLLFSFTVGGTECLVTNICNQMSFNNQDVHLYIINDLIDENLLNSLDERIHIKLLRRKVGAKDKLSPLIKVAKYIKENKIEVVHCNSFNAPELLVLSKIINPKCKIISTIHGVNQFQNLGKVRVSLKNRICDQFIGISDVVRDEIIDAGINANKVTRVYNGIDTKKYKIAKQRKFDKNAIVIGCVARIMPELKGQDILLEAVKEIKAQYPNILVLFAGGVAKNQFAEYEKLIQYTKENELTSNVKFLGNVENIPEFLNNIDICVVPSRSEGFGLALVEALSMGVPCIASNIAGPREIILNEQIGNLFESGNPTSLSMELNNVILRYIEIKELTWNCRSRIIRKYSIENMCGELLNVYTKSFKKTME